MKKRTVIFVLLLALLLPQCVFAGDIVSYSDVPEDSWAKPYIQKITELTVMQGVGQGAFGYGENIKRSEFAAMLTRLFGWQKVTPETSSFTDVSKDAWYYSEVSTAVLNGAITEGGLFRPEEFITREEMAVMLVSALGFSGFSGDIAGFDTPFSDVSSNQGMILMASDFGIITGKGNGIFDPKGNAKREDAAAMMVRLAEKYKSQIDFLHGFYAFSSWSQKELIPSMNNISYGWSKMDYSPAGGAVLNTSPAYSNEWSVPSGYDSIVNFTAENQIPENLNVFLSASTKVTVPDGTSSSFAREILLNPAQRTQAVQAIMTEATRVFPLTGTNPYSGVTIDFENMKGSELKNSYNEFLRELKASLDTVGKSLYVAVPPVGRPGMSYFDGYDYKTIGEIADKVILMAHDYSASSLDDAAMNSGFTTTPVTPAADIYYALRAITDPETGVIDHSKIALAISFGSTGWSLQNGKVVNKNSMKPAPKDIYARLVDSNTTISYSARQQNPYIKYYDSTDNTDNIVWYEDERSVDFKMTLAKMFGINGLSLWRLGIIPDYDSPEGREIYYNVWDSITPKVK